jgi:PAS domain S-box-containing protein
MAIDVTDRMRAEEALQQSEERYRSLTQAITSVVWTTDAQGRFVTPQIPWSNYTGQTWDELRDFGWANALHPDDREQVRRLWETACASQTHYYAEGRLWHAASRSYRRFEARGVPILNPDGSVREWVGKCLDVEDRKRAEENLRLLWEAAALLLSANNPDAMLRELFAKIGPYLGMDTYFNYMVEESGDALRLESCIGIPDPTALSISRLAFGQTICGTAALQRRPIVATHIQESEDPKAQLAKSFGIRACACYPLLSGEKLLGTLSFASRTRNQFNTDELAFLETTCHYVTLAYERLRLLNELKAANRQKDEFLAMLAHELRNPLAAIRYATELSRLPSVDPKAELIDVIERQVENLVHLIDDLLDISRISRGKVQLHSEAGDLRASVRRAAAAVRQLMEEKRHALTMDLAEEPLPIYADSTRIEQVVGNLLTNAAKYTPEGGRIHVQVRSDGGEAVLKVKDSGIGIAPEILPHVFELFTQADRSLDRSQGGLGIGLTVVQKLVELHGGRVAASSEGIAKGAEFIVRLPLSQSAGPSQADSPRTPDGPRGGLRIVIVEDNRDTARTSALLLESQGHRVSIAHAGNEGVELALRQRPHAMLVDIGLPGLNGYEVAATLRNKGLTRTTLIAVSGYGRAEDRERSRAAGFDHHLIKPVDNEQLFGLLHELDAARLDDEPHENVDRSGATDG